MGNSEITENMVDYIKFNDNEVILKYYRGFPISYYPDSHWSESHTEYGLFFGTPITHYGGRLIHGYTFRGGRLKDKGLAFEDRWGTWGDFVEKSDDPETMKERVAKAVRDFERWIDGNLASMHRRKQERDSDSKLFTEIATGGK